MRGKGAGRILAAMRKPNIQTVELAEKVIRELLASDLLGTSFYGERKNAIYFLLDNKNISPELAQTLWGGTTPPPRPYKQFWWEKLGFWLIVKARQKRPTPTPNDPEKVE